MAKPEKLDSIIRVVTPENIAFEYRLAGPFRRLSAFLIDFAIVILINFLVIFLFGMTVGMISGGLATFMMLVTWFAVFWFFGGICETFLNGQTPGKWLLGLGLRLSHGPDGNDIGVNAKLRVNFDFKRLLGLKKNASSAP